MSDEKPPTEIRFHYIKSPQYRVVHSDGVYGGLTPSGHINLTFYSERFPIPKTITHEIGSDGSLGSKIARESREGIVREIEVGVTIAPGLAQALRDWLDQHLQGVKK